MTFARPWVGRKRVAFVPVFRPNAAPPDQIPPTGRPPSSAGSSTTLAARPGERIARFVRGCAPPPPVAPTSNQSWLPMQTIDKQVVEADELEGSSAAGCAIRAWTPPSSSCWADVAPAPIRGFWSRVVMAESNGVWLMELMHGLTGFKDFITSPMMPTRRSAPSTASTRCRRPARPTLLPIPRTSSAGSKPRHPAVTRVHRANYALQHLSLPQPPAAGRAAAVRIGTDLPYVMVEAQEDDRPVRGRHALLPRDARRTASTQRGRDRVSCADPRTRRCSSGGRNKKPLYLMTLTALQVGQSAALDNG